MGRIFSCILGLFGLWLLFAVSAVGWGRNKSPFQGWLVFEVSDGVSQQLYRMEANGTHLSRLSSGDSTAWEYPQWSPDGSWILAAENSTHQMMALRPYGKGVMQPINSANFAAVTMRWSPNGNQIAYTSFFERYMNVHLASIDGNASLRLTNFGEYRNGDAMWSPDGTRLAFVSNRDGLSEIFQMDTAGETIERMTSNSNVQTLIGWSQNGEGLYFLSYLNAIVYTTMDGTDQQQSIVQERGRIASVDLSPDGKWLVYITLFREGIQQDRHAFLVGTNGEQRRQILPELELLDDFVWSPDGRWLAFTADINGYRQLFRVRSNGGRVEQLTFSSRNHARPDWSPIIDKGLSYSRLLILIFTLLGLSLAFQFRPKRHKPSINPPK